MAVNDPYYEQDCLFAGPPPSVLTLSTTSTTGGSNDILGSGTWSDGSAVTVQRYSSAGAATPIYVAIRVGETLSANCWDRFTVGGGLSATQAARVKDIGKASNGQDLLSGSGAAYGEDAASYRHRPLNGIADNGLVFVIGDVNAPGAGTQSAAFAAIWNDTASRWEMIYRTPQYNTSTTAKENNWTRPVLCYLDSPEGATEAFLVWHTYETVAANTYAGVVMMARVYRTAPGLTWSVDAAVEVFRPEYDTTALGGGTQTHIHSAVLLPWGTNGMALVVSIGHADTHSAHLIVRSDRNYTQGWSPTSPGSGVVSRTTATLGSTCINPTATTALASGTDGASLNGWTTNRYAAGDLSTNPNQFNPQWMSFDRVSNPAKFLASSDESYGSVSLVSLPSVVTDKLTAVPTREQAVTSLPSGHTSWGIVRPNPSRYADYATIRFPDNVTTTRAHNVKTAIGTGAITQSGAELTINLPGTNPSSGHTIELSGFSGPDVALNAVFTANSNSTSGVWKITTAVGAASNTTTGVASFAYTARTAAAKVMYSPSGDRWVEIGSIADSNSKDFILGWHGPSYVIAQSRTTSNRVLRAYKVPVTQTFSPIAVSPAVKNYAQSSVSLGSTGTDNTISDVTATYTTADAIVSGRTIPPVPSNGRVLRATATIASGIGSTSNVICTEIRPNGSFSRTIPFAEDKIRFGLWVYLLPTRTGFSSNTTAPFNSWDAPYLGIRIEGDSGPTTTQLNTDLGLIPASGWYYYQYEFDVDSNTYSELTGTLPGPTTLYRFYIRLLSSASARFLDCLLCIDHECAGATIDPPTIPPPCGSSATTTETDHCSVNGYDCEDDWTMMGRFQLSPRGWDSYTKTAYRSANRRLFTLKQNASRYISCAADTVNSRLVFTDGTNTTYVSASSPELFEFNLLSPVTIVITKADAGSGNSTMRFYASVGGTQLVDSGNVTWNTSDVRPVSAVLADSSVSACDGILVNEIIVDESVAYGASAVATLTSGTYRVPTDRNQAINI